MKAKSFWNKFNTSVVTLISCLILALVFGFQFNLQTNTLASPIQSEFTTIADTYVNSDNPNNNYGSNSSLYIDGGPNSALGYLKFDLSPLANKTLLSVVLRVRTTTNTNAATSGTNLVKLVNDAGWSEALVNFNNRPTVGQTLGSLRNPTINTSYDVVLDAPALQSKTGGMLSIAIETSSTDGSYFNSGNFSTASSRPKLIITYESETSPTAVPALSPTPTTTPTATPAPTSTPTTSQNIIIAAAGDISCGTSTTPITNDCYQSVTADLISQINPNRVFALGDTQYSAGQYQNYLTYYAPSWGRFKNITHPVVGNHEYGTSGAKGYFDYFNGINQQTGPAGDRSKGYYSFDIGDWHIVALNSECSKVSCSRGSAQEIWLRNDLQTNQKLCTAAIWHRQYFTSGSTGPNSSAKPLVEALYDHNADLILGGHNHYYERFLPQDPNYNLDNIRGLISMTIGTGGSALSNVGNSTFKNIAVRNGRTFGVSKITLRSTSWDWQFVPAPGFSFSDSGTFSCH